MKKYALMLTVIVLVAGCNPIYTDHDYDPAADFSRYQTYSWMKLPEREPANAAEARQQSGLVEQRVKGGVNEELAAKGLTMVDEGGELLVVYYMGAKQITEISHKTYGAGDWYASTFVGGGDASVDNVTEGSIIIDLVDAATQDLVWRGRAETAIKEGTSQQKRDELLSSAITKVFEEYPPKK